ncbi:lysine transporter LysE [Photobacterium sanctipauli]|uniref:Lysine transporter LysE n=3 Tax=Photobacterium sanctipauli TaxID=1342794 RepID=A0A2T3NU32_9GAMM|nr:LysE family translocator [Photobacterium sanctipauli]PSW19790.1 lysine transporter LysE [Photobacterium sanctipauli]
MDYQQLVALTTFAFVATASPGPNNIMLMTSGANVGFMKTVPHMLGVMLGFSFMVIIVGIGLTGVFQTYPIIQQALEVLCLGYLFYLAAKIALSKPQPNHKTSYKPMSFLAAASFQWVNPKGWTMALTTISVFNSSNDWLGVVIISAIFALVTIPSVSFWTVAGKQLQTFLESPTRMKWFNYSMAGLLVLSVVPMM